MPCLTALFPITIIDGVLDLLLPLLLGVAGNSEPLARTLAWKYLENYDPTTCEELFLAAEVISFRHKALAMLHDAALADTPDSALALTRTANTLRRNEAAAQRKLDALQRARRKAQEAAATAAADELAVTPPQPESDPEPPAVTPAAAAGAATPAAPVPDDAVPDADAARGAQRTDNSPRPFPARQTIGQMQVEHRRDDPAAASRLNPHPPSPVHPQPHPLGGAVNRDQARVSAHA